MKQEYVSHLQAWFTGYADRYIEKYTQDSNELVLKKEHSQRVMEEIKVIAAELGCSEALSLAAQTAAILHDVGRFEQYAHYGTFADAQSEDHAALGLKVIQKKLLLEQLHPFYSDMIRFAVGHHNKLILPETDDEDFLLLAKMLRDADKIDIFRVVTGYYQKGDVGSVSAMLGIPVSDHISENICRELLAGKTPRIQDIASSSDMILLQTGWIYDINFPVSLKIIKERGYIDILKSYLPDRAIVNNIYSQVKRHMENSI